MRYLAAGLVAVSVLFLAGVMGCSSAPHGHGDAAEPSITVTSNRHTLNAGESVMLTAVTYHLDGAKQVHWKASPEGAKLTAQSNTSGETALFTADQPGTYLVHAEAQTPDGRWVSSETTITVSGSMANVK